MMAIYLAGTICAAHAPCQGPVVVAIASSIATRVLVKPSLINAAADPELVAITATSEAPTAYLMSTPKARTSSGTTTTPPPRPVSDPSRPAPTEPASKSSVKVVSSKAPRVAAGSARLAGPGTQDLMLGSIRAVALL